MKKPDVRALVHTPAELATALVQWAEYIQKHPGIPFGVPSIDKVVLPLRPGDLVGIVARPGHGKSSLMAYLAREEARRIVERGTNNTEAVVYVTLESAVEELESFFQADGTFSVSDIAWGRADLDSIRRKAVKRASIPIWVIGHGISRAGQKMARMTPEVILGAIESMKEDFGVKPTLILFDYLQLIPVERAKDRVQQVTEAPIKIKELALRIGAPAVVGIQAGRGVDGKRVKLAEMQDCQWGSSAEQAADKLFALWRPALTEEPETQIELGEKRHRVTDNLFVVRMLKQRGDKGRFTWALHFDMAYLKLCQLETQHQEAAWYAD